MRISLQYKFIVPFLAFAVVLSAVFGWGTAQHRSQQLRQHYEREALILARHAAEEVLEHLLWGLGHDPVLLVRNLLVEDVLYAQIVVNGEVLAQQARHSLYLPVLPTVSGVRVRQVDYDPSLLIPYLDVVYPLGASLNALTQFGHRVPPESTERLQGVHGYVRLGLSLERSVREIRQEWLMLIGLSLGVAALGILIGWGLYRTILGPLERLSEAVRAFGSGNLRARARLDTGDEIEALAHEFNLMADAIVRQRNELRKANEELTRANRVKSVFLAAMSHELLTPLHSILGYTSLLLDEVNVKLDEAERQYAQAIQRAGKHLLALIENVLHYSKLEAGAERLHLTDVHVEELVHEVAESQRPLADEKGLRLRVDVERDLTLRTDVTKLKQILLNLLHNAIKYTDQGHVHLRGHSQDKHVRFEVIDTGPGIPSELQGTLFEPFVRTEKTGSPRGTGLGLTIAKRYAEMLGGTIGFESEPGRGSRFWVILPKEGSS
jgi:signal transduction histidine kinase